MAEKSLAVIKPGLVSISFRSLTPRQIVDLCVRAGLEGIEWGGDVHVPHGDIWVANQVAEMTVEAGLQVAAYGSYYRVGQSEADGLTFKAVLNSAVLLGAPLIRVWAGVKASAATDDVTREAVEADARRIATMASEVGVAVAYEYHANTLTDTAAAAASLMAATAGAGMKSYWQPSSGWTHSEHMAALRDILPHLTNLHVYHWANRERLPLAQGAEVWADFLAVAAEAGIPRWALLEFVRNDDPEQLIADAATLSEWLV